MYLTLIIITINDIPKDFNSKQVRAKIKGYILYTLFSKYGSHLLGDAIIITVENVNVLLCKSIIN